MMLPCTNLRQNIVKVFPFSHLPVFAFLGPGRPNGLPVCVFLTPRQQNPMFLHHPWEDTPLLLHSAEVPPAGTLPTPPSPPPSNTTALLLFCVTACPRDVQVQTPDPARPLRALVYTSLPGAAGRHIAYPPLQHWAQSQPGEGEWVTQHSPSPSWLPGSKSIW